MHPLPDALVPTYPFLPPAGRELNPWEQSKAYTIHLTEHETPLPVDEEYPRDRKMITLTLHSPNTHKVYVQYCKACIGTCDEASFMISVMLL